MPEIELAHVQEKLRVEGKRSIRAGFVVSKVRRVLWPFIRSYHFITLEWVRDTLQGHLQHQPGADRLSDRQRALQAEMLAASRQNADLRMMLEAKEAQVVTEVRAQMQTVIEHNADLRADVETQKTQLVELVVREEFDRLATALQEAELRISQLEALEGQRSTASVKTTEDEQSGPSFPIGDAVCSDTSFGPMILRRGDLITGEIMKHGSWDSHLIPWLKRGVEYGPVAVDAGAHFGSLSCAMAMHFDVVHSFEPNLTNYMYLCANASLRPTGRILPRNLGLYSEPTTISLAPPSQQEMPLETSHGINGAFRDVENTGGLAFSTHGTGVNTVEAIALDSLHLTEVGFIKVDCQGSDGHVILGAMDTIRRCRPIVVFEWEEHLANNQGVTLDAVRESLEAAGYSVEVAYRHNDKQVDYVAIPDALTSELRGMGKNAQPAPRMYNGSPASAAQRILKTEAVAGRRVVSAAKKAEPEKIP